MMPKRPAATALRRRALAALVITERHRAGLRQLDVARILGRPESWVARIENDDRLGVDVIELVALAAAIGFDPVKAVSRLLQRARARRSQPPPPRRLRRRLAASTPPPATRHGTLAAQLGCRGAIISRPAR
jgi:hypothetical protein